MQLARPTKSSLKLFTFKFQEPIHIGSHLVVIYSAENNSPLVWIWSCLLFLSSKISVFSVNLSIVGEWEEKIIMPFQSWNLNQNCWFHFLLLIPPFQFLSMIFLYQIVLERMQTKTIKWHFQYWVVNCIMILKRES